MKMDKTFLGEPVCCQQCRYAGFRRRPRDYGYGPLLFAWVDADAPQGVQVALDGVSGSRRQRIKMGKAAPPKMPPLGPELTAHAIGRAQQPREHSPPRVFGQMD